MQTISSPAHDAMVHSGFIAGTYNPAANARPKVIEMIKFLSILRRAERPRIRRPLDPTLAFSPREWADLPVYHPVSDEPRR